MTTKSKIEWTNRTWNPVTGCTRVSPGCRYCYAERIAGRFWSDRPFSQIQCHADRLARPLHWKSPEYVFVNSMSDCFHADISNDFLDAIFGIMAAAWALTDESRFGHVFQVLTKRPERMREYLKQDRRAGWAQHARTHAPARVDRERLFHDVLEGPYALPNVWLGVSVENQQMANLRIPLLLDTPASLRWISCEPLLGPVDVRPYLPCLRCDGTGSEPAPGGGRACSRCYGWAEGSPTPGPHVDWVVAGGESGPEARPMHPDWARSLRDQCQTSNAAFFFKQWGEWQESPQSDPETAATHPTPIALVEHTNGGRPVSMERIGKRNAGDLLDGQKLHEYPRPHPTKA